MPVWRLMVPPSMFALNVTKICAIANCWWFIVKLSMVMLLGHSTVIGVRLVFWRIQISKCTRMLPIFLSCTDVRIARLHFQRKRHLSIQKAGRHACKECGNCFCNRALFQQHENAPHATFWCSFVNSILNKMYQDFQSCFYVTTHFSISLQHFLGTMFFQPLITEMQLHVPVTVRTTINIKYYKYYKSQELKKSQTRP